MVVGSPLKLFGFLPNIEIWTPLRASLQRGLPGATYPSHGATVHGKVAPLDTPNAHTDDEISEFRLCVLSLLLSRRCWGNIQSNSVSAITNSKWHHCIVFPNFLVAALFLGGIQCYFLYPSCLRPLLCYSYHKACRISDIAWLWRKKISQINKWINKSNDHLRRISEMLWSNKKIKAVIDWKRQYCRTAGVRIHDISIWWPVFSTLSYLIIAGTVSLRVEWEMSCNNLRTVLGW